MYLRFRYRRTEEGKKGRRKEGNVKREQRKTEGKGKKRRNREELVVVKKGRRIRREKCVKM